MQQVFAPPHRIFRHQLNLFEYASSFPLQLKFNALSKRILWTPSLLCLPPFCYHPKHFLSWWVSFEASQFPLTSAFFWVGGIVCVHVSKRLHQIPEVWRECAICCHISLIIWYFSCMLYFVWTSLPRTYNRIKLGGLRVGQLWRGGGYFWCRIRRWRYNVPFYFSHDVFSSLLAVRVWVGDSLVNTSEFFLFSIHLP